MKARFVQLAVSAFLIGLFGLNLACEGGGNSDSATEKVTTENSFLLPGGVMLELVPIPKGTFKMGRDNTANEGPQHQVTIGQDFYMAKFETTLAQWQAVMGSIPSAFRVDDVGVETDDPTRPVVYMGWDAIRAANTGFLDKLNAATEGSRPKGMVFRLPTEAEWEYANLAGETTLFYWGDDPNFSEINKYAWYDGNAGQTSHGTSDLKLPNAFGLYNMSGNVSEWCEDDFMNSKFINHKRMGSDYNASGFDENNGSPIPTRPDDGSAWRSDPRAYFRVRRGCGWRDQNSHCTATHRDFSVPHARGDDWGFRVVLAPE